MKNTKKYVLHNCKYLSAVITEDIANFKDSYYNLQQLTNKNSAITERTTFQYVYLNAIDMLGEK